MRCSHWEAGVVHIKLPNLLLLTEERRTWDILKHSLHYLPDLAAALNSLGNNECILPAFLQRCPLPLDECLYKWKAYIAITAAIITFSCSLSYNCGQIEDRTFLIDFTLFGQFFLKQISFFRQVCHNALWKESLCNKSGYVDFMRECAPSMREVVLILGEIQLEVQDQENKSRVQDLFCSALGNGCLFLAFQFAFCVVYHTPSSPVKDTNQILSSCIKNTSEHIKYVLTKNVSNCAMRVESCPGCSRGLSFWIRQTPPFRVPSKPLVLMS